MEARSLRFETASVSGKNGSSLIRQPNAADGNHPYWLSDPNRDDPSRRSVAVKR